MSIHPPQIDMYDEFKDNSFAHVHSSDRWLMPSAPMQGGRGFYSYED